MSMRNLFREWHLQGVWGGNVAYAAGVGLYRYQLTASQPDLAFEGPNAPRPVSVPAPTAAPRSVRRRIPESPSSEVVQEPRMLHGFAVPNIPTRFNLTFAGGGAGIGLRLSASGSTPRNASAYTRVYFTGESRCAAEFMAEGFVLDLTLPNLSGGDSTRAAGSGRTDGGALFSIQTLLIDCPQTLFGGLVHFAHRIEQTLRDGSTYDPVSFFRNWVPPTTAIGIAAGTGHGIGIGATLFGGAFVVSHA